MSTQSNRNFAIAAAASLIAAAAIALVTTGATARANIAETTVRISADSPAVAMHSAAQASIEELRQSLEIANQLGLH